MFLKRVENAFWSLRRLESSSQPVILQYIDWATGCKTEGSLFVSRREVNDFSLLQRFRPTLEPTQTMCNGYRRLEGPGAKLDHSSLSVNLE